MKVTGLVLMLGTLDLRQTIEFYKENLDFECRGMYPDQENPCWASLWNGEVEIAFSAHDKQLSMTGTIYLYVKNVEEVWKGFRANASKFSLNVAERQFEFSHVIYCTERDN